MMGESVSRYSNIDDNNWMQHAYELALHAETEGEVPIGAIVVKDNEIIGSGYNQSIINHDPTAHAEIIALRDAANTIKNYRLVNTTLYVTLEPCIMCAGAIIQSRIQRLVYAAADNRAVVTGSVLSILNSNESNHSVEIQGGVLESKCSELLKSFFKNKRQ